MFKKTIKMLVIVVISMVLFISVQATTKEDIVGYVNSQSVCGDTALYNSYKSTFTRLLRQKSLSSEQLGSIYGYLQNSVGILNSKGVCKIADLSKLSEKERNSIYGNLAAGARIITNAPALTEHEGIENIPGETGEIPNSDEVANTEGTKITINTQDNTMDVYENEILVDKVSMSVQKLTYTGTSTTYILVIIATILVFIASLIPFILLIKNHTAKTRLIKNMLISLVICSFSILFVTLVFKDKIESIETAIKLISFNTSEKKIQVKLNEDKTIKTYPSYGSSYGTLSIPSIDVKNNIYFGDTNSVLSLGIGHTTWSNMPTEGGAIIYSGHNKKDMLYNLQDIKVKQEIIVDTTYAKCTYVVEKTEVLKDTEVDKLVSLDDKETLILYTCYPFDTYIYTNQRFVVYATLKETQWK